MRASDIWTWDEAMHEQSRLIDNTRRKLTAHSDEVWDRFRSKFTRMQYITLIILWGN
jgi:hypothetical protein